MSWRLYCAMFFAMSGLLFAFNSNQIWAVTFLLIGLFPYLNELSEKKSRVLFVAQLSVGFLFFMYGTYVINQHETRLLGSETEFQGSVYTPPQLTSSERDWSFHLVLEHGEKIQLFYPHVKGENAPASINDKCVLKGKLEQPSSVKNPYSFDYKKYLFEQRIHWIIRINNNEINCEKSNNVWRNAMYNLRTRGIEKLLRKDDSETSALITALVFGDRSYMNEEKINQYRELGILHLLAVSGLHVGLVTFSFYFMLYRIGITREWSSFLLFCFLPVYIFIAGGAPSVLRASMMCMVFLLVVTFNWKIKAVDVVGIVGLLLLMINPFYMYHLGFQLSFLTSFSLLLSTSFLKSKSPIYTIVKVSALAQLVTLPFTFYHSFELSLFTLPMNVLFIPFISLWVLPLSFITVICQSIFPIVSEGSYWLASRSLQLMDQLLTLATNVPWSVVVFGRPSEKMMLLMFIAIIGSFLLFEKKRYCLGMMILSSMFFIHWVLPYVDGKAYVTMIDVGQGDAILIELPYRRAVYLIDTGGIVQWDKEDRDVKRSSGPGKYAVEPFLKGKGIAKVDYLFLTHGHVDHIGEACYISSAVKVKQVLYPKGNNLDNEAKTVLTCLKENDVPISFVKKGQRWNIDNQSFFILGPDDLNVELSENDRSIVLFAVLNDVSLLFTGDIEETSEQQLLKNYPDLSFDILKVAHHGSQSSTTDAFVEQFAPNIGLISAGENNRFGHPHLEVTERLEQQGVDIYRTDKHGAITLALKNGEYKISPFIRRTN
ncbi:DNA internalization-related competence protein ComEC/Rec2 [Salipaludibacillus daqingensis]|uniref:DNA internalization-related competence protein ComEC/Rec2 n=1 Tax=Salipaludibacillus daqingensis TaxID=3041001 RepID=UPI0024752B5E|nr:DNA internalization-related competence protein ComEC/Rec2 [Salipaludibacillus daqingensis]